MHPNGDAIRRYLKLKSLQLKILNQKQVFLKHKHDTLDLDDSACSTAAWLWPKPLTCPPYPPPQCTEVRKKAEKKSAASLAKVEMLQRKMKSVTAGMDHSLHSQDCIGVGGAATLWMRRWHSHDTIDFVVFAGVRTIQRGREHVPVPGRLPQVFWHVRTAAHMLCVCVYACACVRVRACACVCVSPAVPMTWGRVLYSRRMCMPRQMRFRGKYRLRVEKATEPSAIVWQNLDTPMWNKCCRRMLSLLAMIVRPDAVPCTVPNPLCC